MSSVYFFSGPCGCGKTTLSKAFAMHLVNDLGAGQVYMIHGDGFCDGFIDSGEDSAGKLPWGEKLKFNWECLLQTADSALRRGLDVVIDYVIEDELPLVQALAQRHGATLYYIVLTASEEAIQERIASRGDVWLTDRALFLKQKLDHMKENQGHLFDNTNMTVEDAIEALDVERFIV